MNPMDAIYDDAARFRFLCQRPDWRYIEQICLSITFDSSGEFLTKLRAAIDERMAKPQHPFGDLAASLETPAGTQPAKPLAVLHRGEGGAFRVEANGDALRAIYALPPGEHPLYANGVEGRKP